MAQPTELAERYVKVKQCEDFFWIYLCVEEEDIELWLCNQESEADANEVAEELGVILAKIIHRETPQADEDD